MTTNRLVLVLGGTRSGKSAVAERLAEEAGGEVRYLATAPSGPGADHGRIAVHRARRPASWETLEVAAEQDLARPVRDAGDATVLLDGLGTWLAGVLYAAGLLDDDGLGEDPADAIDGASAIASLGHAVESLARAATERDGLTIVVGEEAGMAPVAPTRGARRWVDLLGTAHQVLAAHADRVLLVVAGRVVELPTADAVLTARPTDARLAPAAAADGSTAAPAADGPTPAAADGPTASADGAGRAVAPTIAARAAEAPRLPVASVPADEPRDGAPTPAPAADAAPGESDPAADATPATDGAAETPETPAAEAPAAAPATPAANGPVDAPETAPAEETPETPAPLPAARPVPPGARIHGDRMVPHGMLDFAVNVVDGDPPGWARVALQAGLNDLGRYPDDRAAAHALGERHGRPAEGVLPLGGAAEGFWRVALAVRPRRAAVVVPGFTESEAALRTVGTEIVRVPREAGREWALDPEAVPEDCDFVVLGRPENPTGVLDPRETVLRLRRPGRTVLVDEAFADFAPGSGARGALADERPADQGPGDLLVLRSLTKTLSVAGIRCGYLLGDPDTITRVRQAGAPWSCPTPALELLRAYALRPDACERIAARTAAHRGDLVARLRQLAGVQVWDGAANFVLVRVPHGVDVVEGLHTHGIAVRPCTNFAGLDDRYVRIAVRTPALHARLTAALAAVLGAAEHGR